MRQGCWAEARNILLVRLDNMGDVILLAGGSNPSRKPAGRSFYAPGKPSRVASGAARPTDR